MKTLVAQLQDNVNLENYANAINNGRTDGIYFYVNGNKVTVSYCHNKLNEEIQKDELTWFLKGRNYIFI